MTRTFAAAACLLLATTANLHADATEVAWLGELTTQIGEKHGCEVAFFQRARQYALGGQTVQEAHVTCMDRRQYDARRVAPAKVFTFEDCTPVVC